MTELETRLKRLAAQRKPLILLTIAMSVGYFVAAWFDRVPQPHTLFVIWAGYTALVMNAIEWATPEAVERLISELHSDSNTDAG